MFNREHFKILVCPETKQSLRALEEGELVQLNQLVEKSKVKNRAGDLVKSTIEAGLLRDDGKVVYPIIDGIPVMLVDEGIDFSE